jgi:aryl-alcohol dehydrogenase-like predicted oxidoreductase
MKYGTIAGLDRPASRVVLGSMAFSPENQGLTDEMIEAFLERGGNLIDTAHVYRGGGSERAIGDWLRRKGQRERVLLMTKGAHHDRLGKRVIPREIAFDLGQSLERLATSYVDLYVLHRDDPAVPVGPIVEALNQHRERGRMRAIGGSNWSHARLAEANDYARQHGLVPFAVSSPNFALAVPNEPMWPDCISIAGDREALDWYRQMQLPILSWSSQAGGFFSGRFSPEQTENKDMARVYYSNANWERLRRAEQLAKELGSTPIQISLAWVLNQPDLNVFPLIGPRSLDELDSSLAAAEIELSPQQVRWLNLEA